MLLNEGAVLGGRYEIVEKIGSGGMAVVYRARDRKLERYVTVKVLREEYIGDEEFIERFRSEACSAAKLSHPNIVRVYDVGEEGDINYIVMEYIHGDTLKKAIKEKAPFDSRSTINVAIQMASALSQAHKSHIVHRDIKPQNILVGTDGVVKVTDFGIARAATASTMTTTANAAGSVHYFSPEQARGGYVDEKSDIYSLGITMFEMITGVLPFQGNNSVSIALKHINEELPDIRQYNPKCSPALEQIIKKATMKKADERYANIDQLLDDLLRARMELGAVDEKKKADMAADTSAYGVRMSKRKEAAANLRAAQAVKAVEQPQDPASQQEPVMIPQDETKQEEEATRAVTDEKEIEYLRTNRKRVEDALPESLVSFEKYSKKLKISKDDAFEEEYVAAAPVKKSKRPEKKRRNPRAEKDYDNEYDRAEEKKVIAAAIATAIVIILVISVAGVKMLGGFNFNALSSKDKTIEMPYLLGMTLEQAQAEAEKYGFEIEEEGSDYSKYYDAGQIISQGVMEGEMIAEGTVIGVKTSAGLTSESMPNLEGKSENDAIEAISELIGATPIITHVFDDEVKAGEVISQEPAAGSSINAKSEIRLTVSKGAEDAMVSVPHVVGETEEQAIRDLEAVGLVVGSVSRTESDSVKEGIVITQTLSANTEVPSGSVVNLVVSKGSSQTETETPETQSPETQTPSTDPSGDTQQGTSSTTSTKTFTVNAPSGAQPGNSLHVVIMKSDDNGTVAVMDAFHTTEEFPLSVSVTGKGSGTVTCTIDGVQQWSTAVTF